MSTELQNVNDIVEVKLTEAGLRAYRQSWQTYYGSLEYVAPRVNQNGMHEFELWYLMMHLGPHYRMGGPQLLENNTIRVREKKEWWNSLDSTVIDTRERFYRPVHGGYPSYSQHVDIADQIATKCPIWLNFLQRSFNGDIEHFWQHFGELVENVNAMKDALDSLVDESGKLPVQP